MPLFKATFAGRGSTCFFNFNSYNRSTTQNSDSYNRTRHPTEGVLRRDEETRAVLNVIQESLGGLHDRLDALAVRVRPQRVTLHDVLVRTIEAVRGELDRAPRHCGSDSSEDSEALLKNVALLAELLQKLSDVEMHRKPRPCSRQTNTALGMRELHPSPGIPPLPSTSSGV